jgi:hypothetical protein
VNAIEIAVIVGAALGLVAVIAAIQTAWNTAHSASTLKRIEQRLIARQNSE